MNNLNLQNAPDIEQHPVGAPIPELAMADPNLAASAYKFGDLGQYVDFAKVMCKAGEMLPPHARNNPPICLALTLRAVHWGFDPFALAQETFQAKSGGPIGYQAKVFSAALRSNGVKLRYRYEGEIKVLEKPVKSYKGSEIAKRTATGDRKCIAYVVEDGEPLEYETLTLDQITIKNSPLWHNDPDQQLAYAAARGWARRYRSDLLMGAYDDDEVQEVRDVTPRSEGGGGFAALANKARQEEQERSIDGQGGETPQGTEQATHGAENEQDDASDQVKNLELAEEEADPFADAYTEGVTAFSDGAQEGANPYDGHTNFGAWNNWLTGYRTNASQTENTGQQGGDA